MTWGPKSASRASPSGAASGRASSGAPSKLRKTWLTVARIPLSTTARATSNWNQYMSQKCVVPERIISRHARRVPQYTSSAVMRASAGQMRVSSHSMSGRSSPPPRSSVIAAWPWPLTSPGTTARPRPATT